MNENDNEIIDSTNDTETTENNDDVELDLSDDTSDDDVETLKKENATLKAQKEHWKNKAEKKVVTPEVTETPKETSTLSTKDTLAVIEAKVPSADFDEVVRVAKILGKSVADALKDKTLISILRDRAEERQTAEATQTKSPRATLKATGEVLIEKANQGNLPDADGDIAALAKARMERKLQK